MAGRFDRTTSGAPNFSLAGSTIHSPGKPRLEIAALVLRLSRGVRRTNCKREYEDADARNFSIPPCYPASGRETHVAGQKTLRDEKDRHCVARESAMHARASPRSMRDESAPRCGHREISLARAQPDDRVAGRQACRSTSTTQKF